MTAEEKAIELVSEMYLVYDPIRKYPECFDTAKQCALIAVNEILGYMGADRGIEFWQNVKTEIEKL